MYRLSSIIALLLLSASFSVQNAYSGQKDGSWQIGIHSNYHSLNFFDKQSNDYNFWGGGIDIKKKLNNRFFIGADAQFYMPINPNNNAALDIQQFMYSVFAGANLYSTDFYSIYSTLGYQYRFESIKGEQFNLYCATPPVPQTYFNTLDLNNSHHGLRFGTGISLNLKSIHIFAEPSFLVLDGIDFSLSTGIRISLR